MLDTVSIWNNENFFRNFVIIHFINTNTNINKIFLIYYLNLLFKTNNLLFKYKLLNNYKKNVN